MSCRYLPTGQYKCIKKIKEKFTNTSNVISGDWIQVKFPTPFVLTKYTIGGRPGLVGGTGQNRTPATFVLLGSVDGVIWIQLDNRTCELTTTKLFQEFTISENTASFSYYRIIVTKLSPQPYPLWDISQLAFYNKDTRYPPATPVLSDAAPQGYEITTTTGITSGYLPTTNKFSVLFVNTISVAADAPHYSITFKETSYNLTTGAYTGTENTNIGGNICNSNNKCLAAENNSTVSGSNVIQWCPTNQKGMSWSIKDNKLCNNNNLCLDISNNKLIQTSTSTMKWTLSNNKICNNRGECIAGDNWKYFKEPAFSITPIATCTSDTPVILPVPTVAPQAPSARAPSARAPSAATLAPSGSTPSPSGSTPSPSGSAPTPTSKPSGSTPTPTSKPSDLTWVWIIAGIISLGVIAYLIIWWRRRSNRIQDSQI
jgi:hypothetical protein